MQPIAWYLDCINPETGIAFRSITFDAGSVTSAHVPLYAPATHSRPVDAAGEVALGVHPHVRARTLLTMLWRQQDAGGISMGRSYESVVLEAAMELLSDLRDADDTSQLDRMERGDLLNETRSYLSAVKALREGCAHPLFTTPPPRSTDSAPAQGEMATFRAALDDARHYAPFGQGGESSDYIRGWRDVLEFIARRYDERVAGKHAESSPPAQGEIAAPAFVVGPSDALCGMCDGTGFFLGEKGACKHCNGSGRVAWPPTEKERAATPPQEAGKAEAVAPEEAHESDPLRGHIAYMLSAARNIQCACSVKERASGHLSGCWMPELHEAAENLQEWLDATPTAAVAAQKEDGVGNITEADLLKCTLRETDHYNGGRVFFGYGGQVIEHPRLYRLVKYFKADKSHTVEWMVDGAKVKDLSEAAERLNVPPVLTDLEREVYERVPAEFTRCRDEQYPWEIMHTLSRKGMVEYEDGKCRKRAAQPEGAR